MVVVQIGMGVAQPQKVPLQYKMNYGSFLLNSSLKSIGVVDAVTRRDQAFGDAEM